MAFIVEMWGLPHTIPVPGTIRKESDRHFKCHGNFWDEVLKLGRAHGWQPMGTIPSDDHSLERYIEWGRFDSSYEPGMDYGSSKMVLSDDALAWASALEKSLQQAQPDQLKSEKQGPLLLRDDMTEDEFIDANRGTNTRHIREFIAFMRKGGFGFAWDD